MFGQQNQYEPPPNPRRPLLRTKQYRGGSIHEIKARDTPKINRRHERKMTNAALRIWKRRSGVTGRLDSGAHAMFLALFRKALSRRV